MGLFDQPVSLLGRVRSAQVCPYCFAQVFGAYGDLRVRGKCKECSRRLFIYRQHVLSAKEALPYHVLAVAAVALSVALLYWCLL